jgi:hypothetical protein
LVVVRWEVVRVWCFRIVDLVGWLVGRVTERSVVD